MEDYTWVFSFLKEAGELALSNQNKTTAEFKEQNSELAQPTSIVTQTDKDISSLFRKYLKDNSKSTYTIIDEETVPSLTTFLSENKNEEYVWMIDPIDGTRPYYQGFNLWGILLALFKNGEPVLSFCYIPSDKSLIYADTKKATHLMNAFTKDEDSITLANHKELTKDSIVICPYFLRDNNNNVIKYRTDSFGMIDLSSAAIEIFNVHNGNAHGAFFGTPMSLWDIAISILIGKHTGLKLFNIDINKEITNLNFNNLRLREDWVLKDSYVICKPDNYKDIINLIKHQP